MADCCARRIQLPGVNLAKLPLGAICLDETGDVKKGKTTNYISRQDIGNLGKTERGIVSVNAYDIVKGITYPLMFKIFKTKTCIKPQDIYQTKPQLAVEILQ